MGFNSSSYTQTATFWAKSTTRNNQGYFTFNAPVVTKVRWENNNQMVRNFEGREEVSTSEVWMDETLGPEDYLFLGTSVSATPPDTAKQVISSTMTPSVDGVQTEQTYLLK